MVLIKNRCYRPMKPIINIIIRYPCKKIPGTIPIPSFIDRLGDHTRQMALIAAHFENIYSIIICH